jgi:hypothetical protein
LSLINDSFRQGCTCKHSDNQISVAVWDFSVTNNVSDARPWVSFSRLRKFLLNNVPYRMI